MLRNSILVTFPSYQGTEGPGLRLQLDFAVLIQQLAALLTQRAERRLGAVVVHLEEGVHVRQQLLNGQGQLFQGIGHLEN